MKIKFYKELYQMLLEEANDKQMSIAALVILKIEQSYGIKD